MNYFVTGTSARTAADKECEWRFNEGTPKQRLDDLNNILKQIDSVYGPSKNVFHREKTAREFAQLNKPPMI